MRAACWYSKHPTGTVEATRRLIAEYGCQPVGCFVERRSQVRIAASLAVASEIDAKRGICAGMP